MTDWSEVVAERWAAQQQAERERRSRPWMLGFHTLTPTPYTARLTVREACAARGLSVYRVATSGSSQGTLDRGTVYRMARGDTSRIDLKTLATLAGIMHTLSGQPVSIDELLSLEVSGEPVKFVYGSSGG